MNSIELMIEEHGHIKRMLQVIRKACYGVMQGEPICYEDFCAMIDFVRNYADNHHHGKEEKVLFNRMMEHLGEVGNKIIRNGMLVEHDLGRLYMQELEGALQKHKEGDEESRLDIIANAVGYVHLLTRHIAKEDEVVYTFAERQLKPEILEEIHAKAKELELEAEKQGVQNKYLELLATLEKKYLG